jgi:hypothetical protein
VIALVFSPGLRVVERFSVAALSSESFASIPLYLGRLLGSRVENTENFSVKGAAERILEGSVTRVMGSLPLLITCRAILSFAKSSTGPVGALYTVSCRDITLALKACMEGE